MIILLLCFVALSLCLSPQIVVAQAATVVPTANLQLSTTSVIPFATNTPRSSPAVSLVALTATPSPTIPMLPSNTLRPSATPTPRPPSPTYSPPTYTPDRGGTPAPTRTPPPPDPARQVADHYYLSRPMPDRAVDYIARTYPYGNTAGGRLQVHKGVDIVNPSGVEVLAAADGVVVFAGDDLGTLFGPVNNYYGNLVVVQHPFTDASGLPVFTLYGHLARVDVVAGQVVVEGDWIGTVGGTGVAQGPHLHLEVRVGNPNDFGATRNPDLWIRPYGTFGTLAGRITDAAGNLLYDATIIITADETTSTRYAFSYADDTVNGDTIFNENYTMGDLPAGYYTVTVSDNGNIRFRESVYVYPNRTTWLNIPLE